MTHFNPGTKVWVVEQNAHSVQIKEAEIRQAIYDKDGLEYSISIDGGYEPHKYYAARDVHADYKGALARYEETVKRIVAKFEDSIRTEPNKEDVE